MKIEERKHLLLRLYELPQDEFHAKLHRARLENLIIDCTPDRKFDVGALCYERKNYRSRKSPKPVDLNSFRPERAAPLRNWCELNCGRVYEGASGYSLYRECAELIRFAVWCDENSQPEFLVDANSYKYALDAYTAYLLNCLQSGTLAVYTASRLQAQALESAQLFFPGAPLNFYNDLPLISDTTSASVKTRTASAEEMTAHLTACQYLFDGLADFLLNNNSFPQHIKYRDTYALLTPTSFPITTQSIIEDKEKIQSAIYWNYNTGKVNPLEECLSRSLLDRSEIIIARNNALKALEDANIDMRHPKRMWLAKMCQDAFFCLFVANTGLNFSPLRNLLYSEKYDYAKGEKQGFRTVKARAGGMSQSFEIKASFVKHFKKYLKLRSFINKDLNSPYLFIGFINGNHTAEPVSGSLIIQFNDRITRFIDRNFKGLTHRELRKYKTVHLLNQGVPVPVVAAIMQHGADTTLSHYADAEEKSAIDEITNTLNLASEIFEAHHAEASPAGGCNQGSRSEVPVTPEGYKPDCKSFLGCIFCDEFRLHADEDGIRKLLSMRHIVSEYISSCSDVEHFQKNHGKALDRIDYILTKLTQKRPALKSTLEKISKEVSEEFRLHPYWERLYERLVKIRVLK